MTNKECLKTVVSFLTLRDALEINSHNCFSHGDDIACKAFGDIGDEIAEESRLLRERCNL